MPFYIFCDTKFAIESNKDIGPVVHVIFSEDFFDMFRCLLSVVMRNGGKQVMENVGRANSMVKMVKNAIVSINSAQSSSHKRPVLRNQVKTKSGRREERKLPEPCNEAQPHECGEEKCTL